LCSVETAASRSDATESSPTKEASRKNKLSSKLFPIAAANLFAHAPWSNVKYIIDTRTLAALIPFNRAW
jgi:hypothetical protein